MSDGRRRAILVVAVAVGAPASTVRAQTALRLAKGAFAKTAPGSVDASPRYCYAHLTVTL